MMNISVWGPSVSKTSSLSFSSRLIVYPTMIPFCLSNGGGLQLMDSEDELNTVASTAAGGAEGTVRDYQNKEYMRSSPIQPTILRHL